MKRRLQWKIIFTIGETASKCKGMIQLSISGVYLLLHMMQIKTGIMEVDYMVSDRIQKLLNDQLNKEWFSAYLYLSIEAYFTSLNLPGFAHWFRVQAMEERDHALIIFNYINRINGRVRLMQIEAPQVDFPSIAEALKLTLEHEQFVTSSIYKIVDASREEKDHKTDTFLQWFITEQVEEEDNADKNIRKFELVKDDGRGILMMDADLAARVYVQAALLAAEQVK